MLTLSADWFAGNMAALAQFNMQVSREQLLSDDVLQQHIGGSLVAMLNLLGAVHYGGAYCDDRRCHARWISV